MAQNPLENPWIRRTRWLTQAFLISGMLNIGFAATFAYLALKGQQGNPISLEAPAPVLSTNQEVLEKYSQLSQEELFLHLENDEPLEEGLTRRDLALASLSAFHHFHVDRALGWAPLQKRALSFSHLDEAMTIPVFAGLGSEQFNAILHYAKTEKWPLTARGLFFEIQRSFPKKDPALWGAFFLTQEYQAIETLLTKTGVNGTTEEIVDLIGEGDWQLLSDSVQKVRAEPSLAADHRRAFLLNYCSHRSKTAAKLLLASDLDFILKRLDDARVLALLELYPENDSLIERFAKDLIASPRTDAVWKRAALTLYAIAREAPPEPYDHALVLKRFFPQAPPLEAQIIADAKPALSAAITPKIHVVQSGDNLWKIAKKYQVSIKEIMRINHLETEKLRPGKKLEIPNN